jgi:hypothetical protein
MNEQGYTPLNDVDDMIRDVEATQATTGTAIQVDPYNPYVGILLVNGAQISNHNVEVLMHERSDALPEPVGMRLRTRMPGRSRKRSRAGSPGLRAVLRGAWKSSGCAATTSGA